MRNRKMKMAILIAIFEFILYMVGATILQFYLPADLGSIIYLIEYYIIALIVIILFNVLFFKKTIDSM